MAAPYGPNRAHTFIFDPKLIHKLRNLATCYLYSSKKIYFWNNRFCDNSMTIATSIQHTTPLPWYTSMYYMYKTVYILTI